MNNKVHISRVLIENFSSKKEIHTKLRLLTPLSAIPTWLIPRDSILTGQHYGCDSEPYKLNLIQEYYASQGTHGYNASYLLLWLSGPNAAYTLDPRV